MHDFGALVAQAAALAASKNKLRGYFLNEDKTSKFAFRVHETLRPEVAGGFCVFFVLQKLASRIYETLTFEFSNLASKKTPSAAFQNDGVFLS